MAVYEGAEGFGANWVFPSADAEYINVTNLNNTGDGSLRDAVTRSSANAGRIITFYGLSGDITLSSPIDIINNNTYIAGQTSENGITIRSNGSQNNALIRTTNSVNGVIVRNVRLRRGSGALKEVNGDCVTLLSGQNIIFDYCSISWSTDEIFNIYGASKVTVQNTILSEALMYSTHAYTTDPTSSGYFRPHSMGTLIGNSSNETSWYNILLAHNNQRSILIGGGASAGIKHEITNMIVYNWGDFGTVISNSGLGDVNVINYLGISGVNTRNNRYSFLINDGINLYVNSIWNNKRTSSGQTDWEGIGNHTAPYESNSSVSNQQLTPFDYPLKNTSPLTQQEILDTVSISAGCFPRDTVDDRIISDVYNNTGSLIDDPSDVGGWAVISPSSGGITDSDNDGIPDSEEGTYSTLFDYVNSILSSETPPTFVPLTSFGITETSVNVAVGNTVQLTRFHTPANATNSNDTWSSSNESIATVSGSGLVTGVSGGSATITRTSLDTTNDPVLSDTCTVNVTGESIPVTGISIDSINEYIFERRVQLSYTISPINATNQNVVWFSGDDEIATVDQSGMVRYNNVKGQTEIFVKTEDGNYIASINLKIFPKNKRRILINS